MQWKHMHIIFNILMINENTMEYFEGNDYLPCRELSCSDIFSSHCLHSWACICSTAVNIGFIAADFFSPFLATTRVHRTLGSDQESYILMLVLAPMKDAHVVSSGRKTYSSWHPTAPAYDCSIALVGVVVHFSKLSACVCAIGFYSVRALSQLPSSSLTTA